MPYPLVTKAAEQLIVPARLSWSCSMRQQKTWDAPLAKIDLAAATRVEKRRKPTCHIARMHTCTMRRFVTSLACTSMTIRLVINQPEMFV